MPDQDFADSLLQRAITQVPALRYAMGLVGIAAALAIVLSITGNFNNPIVPLSLVFVGMIMIFIFSLAVGSGVIGGALVGTLLIWSIMLFFLIFLAFTVSAFSYGVPCNWAAFISVEKANSCGNRVADEPAHLPETASNRVNSFVYDAADPGSPGPRVWKRTQDLWYESQPSGVAEFKIDKRINFSGCDGTVISRIGESSFQIFIPDKGCPNMSMKFRRAPSLTWVGLPPMKDVT